MIYVYLLHFHSPIEHAKHYIGSTADIAKRMAEHASGNGARITNELGQRGIGFTLARVWEVPSRDFERKFKDQNNGPRFCPICHPGDYQKTLKGLQSISKALLERSGIQTVYYHKDELRCSTQQPADTSPQNK